jgi:hypothetical protein
MKYKIIFVGGVKMPLDSIEKNKYEEIKDKLLELSNKQVTLYFDNLEFQKKFKKTVEKIDKLQNEKKDKILSVENILKINEKIEMLEKQAMSISLYALQNISDFEKTNREYKRAMEKSKKIYGVEDFE